jgi:hypothetical protein
VFKQTIALMAEDYPFEAFYYQEEVEAEEKGFWCVDRYYQERVYRYEGRRLEYKEMIRFMINKFKYRGLKELTKEMMLHAQETETKVVIYARDASE